MPIVTKLDLVMARRKMSLTELSGRVKITLANLSNIKRGKARAIRFTTLEALCDALSCQPADLIEYKSRHVRLYEFEINLIEMLRNSKKTE
ncbi:MAG: helix-turn-helix transcriptional regulator [Bacteroidetes bacterium]|jgi:putative transcriptional regulator|nr:helix-turn-helix transcriptional regulator [Bacteroidota bacterium]MBT3750948.1 helix-turn-helix transcriptional regulator [Bacteroidota bacterium]MBT4410812.1 helix-turn-helix transcriptional regulator [Bacteroidota bacterium]MBT5427981.1 helix-turn-helix transcriptional regulator [Bacteroidota bacterium]MBT7092904.1 helix-turn-helix transcriptional regulator [Bacteroidota bacterium]